MRLTDLNPRWVRAGGEGVSNADGSPVPQRTGVGMTFDCPCGCPDRAYVAFANPLDGGPPHISPDQPTWQRTGETFEALTLTPSIQRVGGCQWHGFITNGEAKAC